jgi:hypothetical protein
MAWVPLESSVPMALSAVTMDLLNLCGNSYGYGGFLQWGYPNIIQYLDDRKNRLDHKWKCHSEMFHVVYGKIIHTWTIQWEYNG